MDILIAEILGTAILLIFGDGVVAGVLLKDSKAEDAGWITITWAWGIGVALAVYIVGGVSGAHINPAVTFGLAALGRVPWGEVPIYVIGQMIGGFIGAVVVWVHYLGHWEATEDADLKLAAFCTAPAIRNATRNVTAEFIGTAVLLIGVLGIGADAGEGNLPGNLAGVIDQGFNPLLVGLLVFAIGLSLGGPTGYAINPARDLAPRIAHAILPVAGKRDSDWSYSWIPVVGPIAGGIVGALIWQALSLA